MDVLEPTEQERRLYYVGLPSSPRLVARSGTEPWTLRLDGWSCYVEKTLRPVGEHPIVGKWNDDFPTSLRGQAVSLVEQRGLHWHAIDALRIGYHDVRDAPVVVFISVEPGSLSWREGRDVATQFRLLLTSHQLPDVQCEIKESRLVKLAAPRVLRLPSDDGTSPHTPEMSLISDCVGSVISPSDMPTLEGTSCLYLCDGRTHATYALTCRHVCFGVGAGAMDPGDLVELLPSTAPSQSFGWMPKKMIQPGTTTFNKTLSALKASKEDYQAKVQKFQERASMVDDDRLPGLIQYYQSLLANTTPVLAKFQARTEPSSRTFGQVAYFRGYAIRRHGELSDWSLVRLDPDRYKRTLSGLENRVFVGTGFSTLGLDQPRLPDPDGTCRLQGLLGITVPRTEGSTYYSMPTGIVAKRGAGSGLTFGMYNEAKSVLRTTTGANSTPFIAIEWCVVSYPQKRDSAFSKPGDSGACIWDTVERRIAGMVTSGLGRDAVLECGDFNLEMAVDVTYSTPMEWLLEDMAACGLQLDVL